MTSLPEFLLARVAEDEAAVEGFWSGDGDPDFMWGPGRIRVECEAKRRIVVEHGPHPDDPGSCVTCSAFESTDTTGPPFPCPTLRLLALPYADHEDYLEEWKP